MRPAVSDPPEVHRMLWDGYGGDVGWDIGANCGQTLPEMTSRFKTIFAFEPAEECWSFLEDFGEHVSYLKIALSDVDDTIDLIELPDKIDTGQLVSADAVGMEYDPDSADAVNRPVIARTVDNLIERFEVPTPDFMKIDVEGHELKVLYGARKTLSIQRPDLLIEFHSEELNDKIQDLLAVYDYKVQIVRHPHYPVMSPLWLAHGWLRARQQ